LDSGSAGLRMSDDIGERFRRAASSSVVMWSGTASSIDSWKTMAGSKPSASLACRVN